MGSRLGFRNFAICMVLFFGITPVIYHKLMDILGKKLKEYIELHDQEYLGVDVHIEELHMCICYARFTFKGFRIDNPKGYNSEYLMHCNEVTLDLDLLEIICSKGKKIVVEEFTIDNVDVIMEYDSIIVGAGKSNVDTVLDFMSHRNDKKEGDDDDDASKKDETGDEKPKEEEKPKDEKEKKDGKDEKEGDSKKKSKRETKIQKVAIVDVGARVQASTGLGQRAAIADMRYNSFSEQFKAQTPVDILGIILKSIMKSIITNVAGKAIGQKVL